MKWRVELLFAPSYWRTSCTNGTVGNDRKLAYSIRIECVFMQLNIQEPHDWEPQINTENWKLLELSILDQSAAKSPFVAEVVTV